MVSETKLATAYATAGFYAYPSDKPETSGIALMKAQATVNACDSDTRTAASDSVKRQ